MGAHRYWRLNLPPQSISNGTFLAEVQFRTSIGGPNAAIDPAKRTSNFGAVGTLFDGNNATDLYAFAGGDGTKSFWIAYDFTTPVEVVEIYLRSSTSAALAPERAVVLYADVADQWQYMFPHGFCSDMGVNADFVHSGWVERGFLNASSPPSIGSVQAFAPTWSARIVGLTQPDPVYRYYWGGPGRIVGTTKIKGTPNTPVSRRVRLIREVDGVCVGERWSDRATGAYEFKGFDPTILYTVIVYDGPRVFRAAVQDAVAPEIYVP